MNTAVRNSRKTQKNQTLKEYAREIGLGCLQERIEIFQMIRRDMIEKNCSLQNIAWEHHVLHCPHCPHSPQCPQKIKNQKSKILKPY